VAFGLKGLNYPKMFSGLSESKAFRPDLSFLTVSVPAPFRFSLSAGDGEKRGRGRPPPGRSPPESPRFVRPERSIRLLLPTNSTRIYTSLSSANPPLAIDPKKAALKTIISQEGSEDL